MYRFDKLSLNELFFKHPVLFIGVKYVIKKMELLERMEDIIQREKIK